MTERKTMIERLEDLGVDLNAERTKADGDGAHVLDDESPIPLEDGDGSPIATGASPNLTRLTSVPGRSGVLAKSSSASGVRLKKSQHADLDCHVYRPTHRPPMALLYIVDDGSRTSGECVRIRRDRITIGREEGDVVVPHDSEMSRKHAEIFREMFAGRFRWVLRDLGSTNGTFVRVTKAPLVHRQEIMIGSRRYRFKLPEPADSKPSDNGAPANAAEPQAQGQATINWQSVTTEDLHKSMPRLIEKTPQGDGERFAFSSENVTVGSDPARCAVVIKDDPFIGGMHARIAKKKSGRWGVEDVNSVNGLWYRVSTVPIDASCEFQLGEQRFLFVVPTATG